MHTFTRAYGASQPSTFADVRRAALFAVILIVATVVSRPARADDCVADTEQRVAALEATMLKGPPVADSRYVRYRNTPAHSALESRLAELERTAKLKSGKDQHLVGRRTDDCAGMEERVAQLEATAQMKADKPSDIGMDKMHDIANPFAIYGRLDKGKGGTKTTAKNGEKKKTDDTKVTTAGNVKVLARCKKPSSKAATTTWPVAPDIAWAPGELQQLHEMQSGDDRHGIRWSVTYANGRGGGLSYYRDFVRKKVSEWLQHLRNPYVSDLKKRQLLRVMIDLTDPSKDPDDDDPYGPPVGGPPYSGDWSREIESQLSPKSNKVDGAIEMIGRVLYLDERIKSHKYKLDYAEKENNAKRAKALKEKLKKETRERNRLYKSIPRQFQDALPEESNRLVYEN